MLERRVPSPPPSHNELLSDFDGYLLKVRGLLPSTRAVYRRHVQRFLATLFPSQNTCNVQELRPRDVYTYISAQAVQGSAHRAKMDACALRSFLRYLVVRGEGDNSLANAVPSVPRRRLDRLPKVLSNEQVATLLESFDRTTVTGRRNFAIALCLARLGLRAGEIARLSLDDINWRAASLCIRTEKGRRLSTLPLPADVGEAIAAYLCHGRPVTRERQLFVQHPRGQHAGASMTACAVRGAIAHAWKRCGLEVASRGTHALRHSLASQMLSAGADLKQIADILRHRSFDTTIIYAKVDVDGLSNVVQAWPEVTAR